MFTVNRSGIEKRNASKGDFYEIQTAEMNLEKIKEELSKDDRYIEVPENVYLMPIESWSAKPTRFYKRFFVQMNGLQLIIFYSKCRFYDLECTVQCFKLS